MPIRIMDAQLRARIAAGEVVERPASVVKELLENALDAGARQIRIDLEGGGIGLIRVCDDGCGIPDADVALAFERHATSKLLAFDDLFALSSLGFRGEALPSIAAVAEMELATCVADVPAGSFVRVVEGVIVARERRGLPVGTTVVARDLFASVPARLKFLKSRAGEVAAVQAACAALALAYPHVIFALWSDGRMIFHTPGTGKISDVLTVMHGPAIGAQLWTVAWPDHSIAVDSAAERDEYPDNPYRGITVRGVIGAPGTDRPSRLFQTFMVNGRWVKNRVLSVALEEGYHTHLMVNRHPIAALALEVAPDTIDVNVHPSKYEIKFLEERAVFSAIRRAVAATLARHAPVFDLSRSIAAGPAEMSTADGVTACGATLDSAQIPLWDAPAQSVSSSPNSRLENDQQTVHAADGGGRLAVAHVPTLLGERLPVLRVLGQSNNLFIIAEGPDGVYMVDQHAAHERVLFDELVVAAQSPQRTAQTQLLLAPLVVELEGRQADVLSDSAAAAVLVRFGFIVEPLDGRACLVRGVPAPLATSHTNPGEVLSGLLEELSAGGEAPDWRDRALAVMACRSAIKAGQPLTMEEMRRLISRLETTTRPRTCPHGRPTLIALTQTQLEREFGRR